MISQAIEVYESERIKQLENVSRPLGNLGSMVARMAGVKNPDTAWFNEFELVQRKRDVNKVFSVEAAEIYVEQWGKGQVPNWVDSMIDIDKMKLAAIK